MNLNKILIIRLSALGDIIQTSFVLEFIKKSYPDIKIDWVVESIFSSILEDNKYLDNLHTIELKKLKQEQELHIFKEQHKKIKQLSENNYDLIIDMQGLLKSAFVAKIIAKNSAKTPKIVGYSFNSIREKGASIFYNKRLKIDYSENTIIRIKELINFALKMNIKTEDLYKKSESLFFNQKELKNIDLSFFENLRKRERILLVIGSTWESRNYPKEKFLELTNQLSEKDFFIIWGNEEEKEKAKYIIQKNENENVFLLPETSLNELKLVVSQIDLIIGNDTGPTHLGWAMNKKSITLFGATPVSRILETKNNIAIKSNSKVNPKKLDKNDFSVRDISVSTIIEEVENLLK